ncbi:MAG: Imm53 family immunity protein [Rickettsiaceae bacterium]|nr:Imm53 family immunity protein [Rickettsiaceae bacterium]MDD9337000.1 Imm53 family immunity protein [Rickettsiaceae bacterium]
MTEVNIEENLTWLQALYTTKINRLKLELPQFISDEQLEKETFYQEISLVPGLLRIRTIANPAWSLNFFYKNTFVKGKNWDDVDINCGINLMDQDSNDWLSINKKSNMFDGVGGPLYLTVILETFRCWVEDIPFIIEDLPTFREKLKQKNPLLSWLEEFYYSCCDEDWEHSYGCSIISVASGWVMAFSLDYLDLEDSAFDRVVIEEDEGTIECYKEEYKFIIRTHVKGLIKGITIFKEWVEIEMDKYRKAKSMGQQV